MYNRTHKFFICSFMGHSHHSSLKREEKRWTSESVAKACNGKSDPLHRTLRRNYAYFNLNAAPPSRQSSKTCPESSAAVSRLKPLPMMTAASALSNASRPNRPKTLEAAQYEVCSNALTRVSPLLRVLHAVKSHHAANGQSLCEIRWRPKFCSGRAPYFESLSPQEGRVRREMRGFGIVWGCAFRMRFVNQFTHEADVSGGFRPSENTNLSFMSLERCLSLCRRHLEQRLRVCLCVSQL